MFTTALFRELYTHMSWADGEVWKVALATPAAASDAALIAKLQHIHMTQRAFLNEWTATPHGRYLQMKFATLRELYDWMRPFYDEAAALIATVDEPSLGEPVILPWARRFVKAGGKEAGTTTRGETMFQLAAHTTYHRGQANTLLRGLGAEPPLVDYIAWLWSGRPAPDWPA
jgi:uncharacterized damage-inducible protein DinB